MKSIKINTANIPAITKALHDANGKADSHTLSSGLSVVEIAADFEKKLLALVGTKKSAPGAKATYVSGSSLPNAYKYSRTVTRIEIERKSSDWFLTFAGSQSAYNAAGPEYLTLTADQDDAAIAVLRKQYHRIARVVAA